MPKDVDVMDVNPVNQGHLYTFPDIDDDLKKEMQQAYAKVVRGQKRDRKPKVTYHQGESLENIMLSRLLSTNLHATH